MTNPQGLSGHLPMECCRHIRRAGMIISADIPAVMFGDSKLPEIYKQTYLRYT
jgi:hypothetical protein